MCWLQQKQKAEQQYQINLAAYTTEEECVRFDQATFDMQFKAAFADHKKRKAAYARIITRAYDLLMLQFWSTVVKERLESQPDYDSKIRDHPIAALQQISVLAHNPMRGRYHYACIYKLLELLLNIQQKDNKLVVTYKDTFKQNAEVLKTHLPTSIVDSYVQSTDAYTKLTTDKECQQLKKEEEEKFLMYVLLRCLN